MDSLEKAVKVLGALGELSPKLVVQVEQPIVAVVRQILITSTTITTINTNM